MSFLHDSYSEENWLLSNAHNVHTVKWQTKITFSLWLGNKSNKLSCALGEHKTVRCRCFVTMTLRLTLMTLKLEGDLDILKMYLQTVNEAEA